MKTFKTILLLPFFVLLSIGYLLVLIVCMIEQNFAVIGKYQERKVKT